MVTVVAAGITLDPMRIPRPLEIAHGRSGGGAQPDAPTATFLWAHPTPPAALGDPLTITEEYAPAPPATWLDPVTTWLDPGRTWLGSTLTASRFVGRVTGLEAAEQYGELTGWSVTATGRLADLGRMPVLLSRPAETDTARAAAILTAAAVPYRIEGAPYITLRADNIDRDALSAIHEVAAGAAALVWQARDGVIVYGTATHRDTHPTRQLPASVIVDGVTWRQDIEAIVNHVTVTYTDAGDVEHQQTFRDDPSIAEWGMYHADAATGAVDAPAAAQLGATILARRAQPVWRQPSAMVDAAYCSPAEIRQLLDLEVSTGVFLPIGATPAPTPSQATEWTVEGWVEAWTTEDGETPARITQLAISDRNRGTAATLNTWADQKLNSYAAHAGKTWLQMMTEPL